MVKKPAKKAMNKKVAKYPVQYGKQTRCVGCIANTNISWAILQATGFLYFTPQIGATLHLLKDGLQIFDHKIKILLVGD